MPPEAKRIVTAAESSAGRFSKRPPSAKTRTGRPMTEQTASNRWHEFSLRKPPPLVHIQLSASGSQSKTYCPLSRRTVPRSSSLSFVSAG